MSWLEELKGLPWRPGIVDGLLDLRESMRSANVKGMVEKDIKAAIITWIPEFEAMAVKLRDDPIAKPTRAEKAFHAWAKRNFT